MKKPETKTAAPISVSNTSRNCLGTDTTSGSSEPYTKSYTGIPWVGVPLMGVTALPRLKSKHLPG